MILAVGPLLVVLAAATSGDGIRAAHERGDADEVVRLAGQAGAAGIAPLLASDDRGAIHAGLAAATHAPDPWDLLGELGELAAGWDRALAAPAARAAATIARQLDDELAITMELPDDLLATQQAAWAALSARADRWADVRVHALEVAALLGVTRRATADGDAGLDAQLTAAMTDADPEVRRAACELVPQPVPEAMRAPLGAVVRDDPDDTVVLAAAQALCADLAFDDRAPAVTTIGDAGLSRLGTLFRGPLLDLPSGALVDAARCLAARGSREDVASLRALAPRAPRAVRAWILGIERNRSRR